MQNLLKRISLNLVLGANLCTILLLWLSAVLTFFSPSTLPHLSLLTLAFPVFLFFDVLFLFFWLLFHARLSWVPLLGAIVVGGYAFDYCPLHPRGAGDGADLTADSLRPLTLVTYNVGGMSGADERDELFRYLREADADIVCLQELFHKAFAGHQEWLDSMSYLCVQSGTVTILSRYPVLGDTIPLNYPTRSNRSLACWIDFCGDSLLVINNHLESTHLSEAEKDDYAHALSDPDRQSLRSSGRTLLGKFSLAASYRGMQADSVCALVDRHPGRSIFVCGDLNDTPVSYVCRSLSSRLSSAFRQGGNGLGFTLVGRLFPVRIDHIFFSRQWTCLSCRVDRSITISDHYPLIARMRQNSR